jgi:hypothetical protein
MISVTTIRPRDYRGQLEAEDIDRADALHPAEVRQPIIVDTEGSVVDGFHRLAGLLAGGHGDADVPAILISPEHPRHEAACDRWDAEHGAAIEALIEAASRLGE